LIDHGLFLKWSKCTFGAPSITYLGHVISMDSVTMDSDKVDAAASWPKARLPWHVCGFLGLVGYYQKFIRDFSTTAVLLTCLLRKEAFAWTPEAAEAFAALKRALSSGPVLQMPYFDRRFVVDCDASGASFSTVLHQETVPWHSLAGCIWSAALALAVPYCWGSSDGGRGLAAS
jgi:hypothetical protein